MNALLQTFLFPMKIGVRAIFSLLILVLFLFCFGMFCFPFFFFTFLLLVQP